MDNGDLATAVSLYNVNRWLRDQTPFWKWMVYAYPKSIEYGDHLFRVREIAYFPSSWLPLYMAGKMTGGHATLSAAQVLMMSAHLIWAVFLGLAVFFALKPLAPLWVTAVSATVSGCLILGGSSSLRYMFFSYWPDFLVLPLYTATVALETYRIGCFAEEPHPAHMFSRTDLLLGVLLFVGSLTDWLFVILALCLWCLRLGLGFCMQRGIRWLLRETAVWGIPCGLAAAVFLTWSYSQDTFIELFAKFFLHAGVTAGNEPEAEFWRRVWLRYIPANLGAPSPYLLPAFLVFSVVFPCFVALYGLKSRAQRSNSMRYWPMSVMVFLISVPCLGHTLLFRDHALEVPYSGLKFLMPWAVMLSLGSTWMMWRIARAWLSPLYKNAPVWAMVVSLVLPTAWLSYQLPQAMQELHQSSDRLPSAYNAIASYLPKNTPTVIFADFIRTPLDVHNSFVEFEQPVWRIADFAEWNARLNSQVLNPRQFLEFLQITPEPVRGHLTLAPLTAPSRFTVVLVFDNTRAEDATIRAIRPFTREVHVYADYQLFILDEAGMQKYWHSMAPENINPLN